MKQPGTIINIVIPPKKAIIAPAIKQMNYTA
jgi:hypothetical protein